MGKSSLEREMGTGAQNSSYEACEGGNGQRQTDRGRIGFRRRQRLQTKTDSKQGQIEGDDTQIVTKTDNRQRRRQEYRKNADGNRDRQQRQTTETSHGRQQWAETGRQEDRQRGREWRDMECGDRGQANRERTYKGESQSRRMGTQGQERDRQPDLEGERPRLLETVQERVGRETETNSQREIQGEENQKI